MSSYHHSPEFVAEFVVKAHACLFAQRRQAVGLLSLFAHVRAVRNMHKDLECDMNPTSMTGRGQRRAKAYHRHLIIQHPPSK